MKTKILLDEAKLSRSTPTEGLSEAHDPAISVGRFMAVI